MPRSWNRSLLPLADSATRPIPPWRVALLIDLSYAKYRLLRDGMLERHGDEPPIHEWTQLPNPTNLRQAMAWQPHAIVLQGSELEVAESVAKSGIPAIDVGHQHPESCLPRLLVDDHAIGRLAAEHLLERRPRTLVCITDPSAFGRLRCRGFSDTAGEIPVVPLPRTIGSLALGEQLRRLPLPFGIFIANPQSARPVFDALLSVDLRIPHQAAVVAADDDLPGSANCDPPMSLIPSGGRVIGRELRRRMHSIVAGRAWNGDHLLPPGGPIIRRSTDPFACDDPVMTALIALLRRDLSLPHGLGSVRRSLELSRRACDLLSHAQLGMPPQQLLTMLRLDEACMRLRSDEPIASVARHCGFASATSLIRVFRLHLGCTPGQWRTLGIGSAV